MMVLDMKTSMTTPILPVNIISKLITHAVWSFDGRAIYYETGIKSDGHEVGVVEANGRTRWFRRFPKARVHTHVGAHAARDWLVLESEDLFHESRDFRFLKLDEPDENGEPSVELICRHGSDIQGYASLQESHGHPVVSPDGKWMCFGAACEGASDVYVAQLKQ